MSPTTETRIATFLAVTLGALVPVLAQAGHALYAGISGALAVGIGTAYHVRTAYDRASGKSIPPPK